MSHCRMLYMRIAIAFVALSISPSYSLAFIFVHLPSERTSADDTANTDITSATTTNLIHAISFDNCHI